MEFQVGGNTYKSSRLDAFAATHVSRRILPVMGALTGGDQSLEAAGRALASLPDADVDYIAKHCLARVERQQGQFWAPVWGAGGLMFADIGMGEMWQIVGYVLRENFQDFFSILAGFMPATGSPAETPPDSTQ